MNNKTENSTAEIVRPRDGAEGYSSPEIVCMGRIAEVTAGQGGDSKDSTDTCIPAVGK